MSESAKELRLEVDALHCRLERWRARLEDAREFARDPDLNPDRRKVGAAFLQEFQDRCDRAENAILRLQRCLEGWQDSQRRIERSFHDLAEAWQSVQLAMAAPAAFARPSPGSG